MGPDEPENGRGEHAAAERGAVALGLGVTSDLAARLSPARNEGWSERLKAVVRLERPDEVDAEMGALLKAAWERT